MSPPKHSPSSIDPSLDADEQTPLLSTVVAGPTSEPIETSLHIADQAKAPLLSDDDRGADEDDEDVPLPKWQIFILCYTKFVDPIAFFSIFPYVNSMIESTGIAKPDVGFYSGMIESLYSATQMCTMIFWGKVRGFSDYYHLVYTLFTGYRLQIAGGENPA